MGKKVKKDEKGAPDDVFDPLNLESRQAQTVVLMLSSPEEDVLSKACEAIYRFVDKCDENKKLLLDLGAVDPLLALAQHEDKIVRRNSTMALGVMAAHDDVRRYLKRNEETIPRIVSLLSPDEMTIIHEFAALCLTHMAQNYTTKLTILEHDGMEPLIQLLSSEDPDVQKNSIETISLLLQDYSAKTILRELNGIPPIIELLKSEYPVIQHLALTSLLRASEDADNRVVLRELEAVNTLISFIGRAEVADMHVFAVMVLSNTLEDPETVLQIKENGGLQKLVAFITDVAPPEEEDKKGKDKKGGSRAGKKGKDEDDRKKGGGEAESVTASLPEVKEYAAKAIARAARNAENRKILHEQEVEKMLILLLSHEDCQVQISAAQALAVMSENMLSRDAVAHWEGLEPLVKLCKHEHPDVRESAALALANLSTNNNNNCSEIVRLKGIDPLINLLHDDRDMCIAHAAVVLRNMSLDEGYRAEMLRGGVVNALIEPLKHSNVIVQSKSAMAVSAFLIDMEPRQEFCEGGGVELLVQLLSSGHDDVRRSASWAVTVAAADETTSVEICRHGGMELLQEIQQSATRNNAFTEMALGRLLNSNLSAKYALTGKLDTNNVVCDGFYDVGSLRPDAQLASLEHYCRTELNNRRAVILVNAVKEKPVTPPPSAEPELVEKASRTSVGRTSRAGKAKAKKEKEERTAKEEEAKEDDSEEAKVFTVPGDNNLIRYIDDVRSRIQPLPTTRDQVVALAMYVSDRMGGPVDRGQLAGFSWELALGQLKFDRKSNVIPIGYIKAGIHYHRALLFKALADRVAVRCTLERGEYNRAWNEVLLTDDDDTPGAPKFPPKAYIVDLMHYPGRLLRTDSTDAMNYIRL